MPSDPMTFLPDTLRLCPPTLNVYSGQCTEPTNNFIMPSDPSTMHSDHLTKPCGPLIMPSDPLTSPVISPLSLSFADTLCRLCPPLTLTMRSGQFTLPSKGQLWRPCSVWLESGRNLNSANNTYTWLQKNILP